MLRNRLVCSGDDGAGGGGAGGGGSGGTGGTGGGGYDEAQLPEAARAELARTRAALKTANEEAAQRRVLLQKYEGIDPDKYKALLDAESKREEERLRKEGEFEKLLAKERENTLAAKKSADETQSRWSSSEIRRELLAAAASLGAMKEAMTPIDEGAPSQIEAVYAAQFEFVEGKVLHRTARDDKGQRLGVAAFLELQKKGAGANLFASSLRSGSGSEGGGSAGGDAVTISRRDPMKAPKVQEAVKSGKRIEFVD
jgi:hypothetical protein